MDFLSESKFKDIEQIREWYRKGKGLLEFPGPQLLSATLFVKWADFEVGQRRVGKALSVIEGGIVLEGNPLSALQQCMESLCEQNFIPPALLDLEGVFSCNRSSPAAETENLDNRLNEIFVGINEAKRQMILSSPASYTKSLFAKETATKEDVTPPEEVDDCFFDRMEQRLSRFHASLEAERSRLATVQSSAFSVLDSSQTVLAAISSSASEETADKAAKRTAALAHGEETSVTKRDLLVAAIRNGPPVKRAVVTSRTSDGPDALEAELGAGGEKRPLLPSLSESKDEIAAEIIEYDDERAEERRQPAPPQLHPIAVSLVEGEERKVRIVAINQKRYQVLEQIGRGGSSKVYKVIGADFKIYALKRVKLLGIDRATLEGYINEVELLQRLSQSPWIIRLLDTTVDKETGYLNVIMEFGEIDLAALLVDKRKEYQSGAGSSGFVNFIRYCWEQILQAVSSLHQHRIVHCDLKPPNFLLVRGTLKLIDFGISKSIPTAEATSVVRENQVGTVNYMAPEALSDSKGAVEGLRIGTPSDVWSLGCILYEMVYGGPPFASFKLIQRLQKIVDPYYEIPFPNINDSGLLDCMKGALDRNPKTRFTISQLLSHRFLKCR